VLRDLVETRAVPVHVLTRIMRQAAGNPVTALYLALQEAEDRTRIYAMPAEWIAWYEDAVTRERIYMPDSEDSVVGLRIVVRRRRRRR